MTKAENEVVEILIRRDGMSRADAEKYFTETMKEVWDLIESGDTFEAEDAFTNGFGLEPDYFISIIGF